MALPRHSKHEDTASCPNPWALAVILVIVATVAGILRLYIDVSRYISSAQVSANAPVESSELIFWRGPCIARAPYQRPWLSIVIHVTRPLLLSRLSGPERTGHN